MCQGSNDRRAHLLERLQRFVAGAVARVRNDRQVACMTCSASHSWTVSEDLESRLASV